MTALLLSLFLACGDKDRDVDTGDVDDTQFEDTDTQEDTAPECTAEVVSITPDVGEEGWYYRDPMSVEFSEDGSAATFTLSLVDSEETAGVTTTWGEGKLIATVTPDPALAADSEYRLVVTICEEEADTTFTTSSYGAPLEGDPSELEDQTSVLLFTDVNFTKPEGIGSLLGMYLDVPLLVGVVRADDSTIDMLVAQGWLDSIEGYKQRMGIETWSFDDAEFQDQPYFEAETESITLSFDGVDIPVQDFHLEGTFSSDGSHFSGGLLSGLGDTRNMGTLFGAADDLNYICNMAAAMAVECVPCPDGEPYCLFLQGEEIKTTAVPDLVLQEVAE